MYESLVNYFIKKTTPQFKVSLARMLLKQIQAGKNYSITDTVAKDIIETVVKSTGNKVIDYIIKD